MIKIENGVIKFEGQRADIIADVLSMFGGLTLLLKDDELIRQTLVLDGKEEISALLDILSQATKELR